MAQRTDIHKILIIGSGPIVIGQACEFDYSGTQACKALRSLGYEIVLVNSNPATIMTDPEMADVTYIEPLNVNRLEQIIAKERPDALLPNLGGQSGLNLCAELYKEGILDKYDVKVIGVQVDAIERGEDRIEFKKTMNMLGIEMARSQVAYSVEEALDIAAELGLVTREIDGVNVINCKTEQIGQKKLSPPDSKKKSFSMRILTGMPNLFGGRFSRFFEPRPSVNRKKCIGCGNCARVCPEKTIIMKKTKGKKLAKIKRNKCIRCFCCQELCPHGAVDTLKNPLIKLIH